jgi:3-oxoacyl-[acyl-carrier-protein] synthase II
VKIVFVYPRFDKFLRNNSDLDEGLVEYFLGDFTTPPSLGIPILASWTPPEHEVALVDDNNGDPVDFGVDADLVAINCFTPQATRAFELGDGYRARGRKVIMGGFFPSFMPDECLEHADAVNMGEGEPTWPEILADVAAGNLKPVYRGGCRFDLSKMRIPRRDLFYDKKSYDWDEDLVQTTRGCIYNCAMCAIPAHMGSRMRFRPIDDVVKEVAQLRFENVYLADDTLFFPQRRMIDYARALFEALAPLGKKYFVASTMALNIDPDFLDLAARAGVKNFYCTMNVDPLSIKALAGEKTEQQRLCDLVTMCEDRDIRFFGSCGLGRDWDDTSIADRILTLFDRAGIHTAEFFLFTPYPGSPQWDRLIRQDRIIDYRWAHYNGAHVVVKPYAMSVDDLYLQFVKVWNEFFRRQKKAHAASMEPATWKNGRRSVGKPLERHGIRGQAVVTGIGVLSPIGNDPETVTAALESATHGLQPITRFDASYFRTDIVGEIRGIDPVAVLGRETADRYDDRYLQNAIIAVRKALDDAGLRLDGSEQRGDIALVLGTCNGGLLSAEEEYKWLHGKSEKGFDEKMNLTAQYYGFGKAMAHVLGITGDVWIVTTACSSTTGALGLAQTLINRGYYSTVIVGGSDTLCVANMSGFDALKAVAAGRTAPFSVPVGLNIGEAACFWVIEEMEQALLRHAHCKGKLAGHATSCDAYHATAPDPRGNGVYRTLSSAFADSGLPFEMLGCVNAHGTGTEANDRAESKGIGMFSGKRALPAVSTKSFFGHCMGTGGILEATCNLLAMNKGFIPPTLNFSAPRPGCTLDYVPNEPRRTGYQAFISANYAFGGNNAATVITRWDTPLPQRAVPDERVVITGAGAVSSLDVTMAGHWKKLTDGQKGIGPTDRLGVPGTVSRLAGLVKPYRPADVDRRLDCSGMNTITRYAATAASGALAEGNLRIRRNISEQAGIVMGVCNGPPESNHMNHVFAGGDFSADIANFSTITANSTAGWVAASLELRGINLTLAPGHHAGLQCCAYAFDMLREKRAVAILAAGSDELHPQTFSNYDRIGYLCRNEHETDYRLRPETAKAKVIGEGAGTLLMETLTSARERGAPVWGEVLGYGMSMDLNHFEQQCMSADGVVRAVTTALQRSGLGASQIDLVVWAPQGNAQDLKILSGLSTIDREHFARVPFATTTFNTGYIETASILISLGMVLYGNRRGQPLWPQMTGMEDLDGRTIGHPPRYVLAVGSSDVGYSFALLLDCSPVVSG